VVQGRESGNKGRMQVIRVGLDLGLRAVTDQGKSQGELIGNLTDKIGARKAANGSLHSFLAG